MNIYLNSSSRNYFDKFPFYTPLNNYQILSINGLDAIAFLNRQLTQDINKLNETNALFSGYCTEKGRVLATCLLWHHKKYTSKINEDLNIYCLIRKDILPSFLKRLSIFVLRDKVKFYLPKLYVLGFVAPKKDLNKLEDIIESKLPQKSWERSENSFGTWIASPYTGSNFFRWWCITDTEQFLYVEEKIGRILSMQSKDKQNFWHDLDLSSGLLWINLSTQNIFTPHAVNLDLIEAISFKKGCYPGQEIIARMHYRGIPKRRMFYGSFNKNSEIKDLTNFIGTDVINNRNSDQPCGKIVDFSEVLDSVKILFELNLNSLPQSANENLFLQNSGSIIKILDLPYAVPVINLRNDSK
ncbi:MAG: folate-binding protein YgfZ [Bordetella sp.]|nr:MAG: folate-binding protein YgfZ [Bordetella sp.]